MSNPVAFLKGHNLGTHGNPNHDSFKTHASLQRLGLKRSEAIRLTRYLPNIDVTAFAYDQKGKASVPVDIDHQIALGFARIKVRGAFTTLLQLDTRLGQIVTQTREVTLGKIKLQWWHDQLAGTLPPAQPVDPLLTEIFNAFRYHDVTFEMMARLTQGWCRLLEPLPFDREQLLFYAHERGAQLFEMAAIVAGCSSSPYLHDAGAGWALADFAMRCGDQNTAKLAKTLATETLCARPQHKLHRDLRPFALLAHFSVIDMQSDIDKMKHKSPRRRAWEAFRFSFSR